MKRAQKQVCRLYDRENRPVRDFNRNIISWLTRQTRVVEHKEPAAFELLRLRYDQSFKKVGRLVDATAAHRLLLSGLTDLMLGLDLGKELQKRLSSGKITQGGFRTTLSQAQAKNAGENFVNAIVYSLAQVLADQDEVLVDKGLPAPLRQAITLTRTINLKSGPREVEIPIEGDLAVFSRSNPRNAIVISAKTRLKEVFHIGTMWALFFSILADDYCLRKWGLRRKRDVPVTELVHVFATADMVPPGGAKTQGGDVEREEVRNLIAMDASFFDYVFVSKSKIPHVSETLEVGAVREALFHELGCLVDLIAQKFGSAKIIGRRS